MPKWCKVVGWDLPNFPTTRLHGLGGLCPRVWRVIMLHRGGIIRLFICVYIRSRIHKISRHLLCETLVFPYGWSLSEFAGILLVIH